MLLRPLLSRTASSVAQVATAATLFAFTASFIRLLPWLTSRSVPLSLCLSFSFSLALAALEVVALAAAPVGSALSCASFTATSSSFALSTIGFSPFRQALSPAFIALLVACLSFLSSAAWARSSSQPGSLLNNMLALASSAACQRDFPVDVPVVRVSVACFNHSPRTFSSIGSPAALAWSADSASFSPRLESLSLPNFHLVARYPALSVRARHATILGLVPSVPSSPHPLLRALSFASCSFLSSLMSSFAVLFMGIKSRPFAFALGSLGPAAFLLCWPLVRSCAWLMPLPLAIASLLPLAASCIPLLPYRFLARLRLA